MHARARARICTADARARMRDAQPGRRKNTSTFLAESLTHAEQAVVTPSLCNHSKPLIRDGANESARWQHKQTREQPRDT